MKTSLCALAVLTLCACCPCYYPDYYQQQWGYSPSNTPQEVLVPKPPPTPLAETPPPSPGPDYVWVDGYWHWQNDDFAWIAGQWIIPPLGYMYVPSSYIFIGESWYYRPFYWNRGSHYGGHGEYPYYGRPRYPYHRQHNGHPVHGSQSHSSDQQLPKVPSWVHTRAPEAPDATNASDKARVKAPPSSERVPVQKNIRAPQIEHLNPSYETRRRDEDRSENSNQPIYRKRDSSSEDSPTPQKGRRGR